MTRFRALDNPMMHAFVWIPDHTGGWQYFADAGVETVVQRKFGRICAERKMMGRFFSRRNAKVLAALIPPGTTGSHWF